MTEFLKCTYTPLPGGNLHASVVLHSPLDYPGEETDFASDNQFIFRNFSQGQWFKR